MLSISWISATLLGLLLFVIGWFVNQMIYSKKNENWKAKFNESDKENKSLHKKVKKETKLVEELRNKSESWKQEFQHSNKELQNLKSDHKQELVEYKERILNSEKSITKMQSSLGVSERSEERLKKELDQLREKYTKDVGDSRQWKSERNTTLSEIKSLKLKATKLNAVAVDYKQKYEAQAEAMEKVNELNREIRGLRAKSKKFEADIAYWEKKHYDTHHELAEYKLKSTKWESEITKLEDLRKGDEILKQNLVGQIQEFKTKFLSVSDKYRALSKN